MQTLDLRDLRCPLPLLRLKQALHRLTTSTPLSVLTTDSGALRDIPAFLRQTPHTLVSVETSEDGVTTFRIDPQV